jgi:LuxR family quorum-sensing system transcriptional regulator CciR
MALALRCRENWEKYYLENKYYEVDPVLQLSPTRRTPFLWDDLQKQARLSPRQKLVLEESRDAGIHNGVSIPVHGPAGEGYIISLATDDVPCDNRPLLGHLHILGVQFFLAYAARLRDGQPTSDAPRLTNRERECLTWSAHGKSAWAIGHILGVSENTVNFHLKSAMRRLGTTNRVQAVALAVRDGLIHP